LITIYLISVRHQATVIYSVWNAISVIVFIGIGDTLAYSLDIALFTREFAGSVSARVSATLSISATRITCVHHQQEVK